jgi:hypothetical protein
VAEHRVDRLAANLKSVPVMVRTGAVDNTVPIWHSRRYARVLQQRGVALEYSEVPGKEHWWWDTDQPNDGGVVFDAAVRKFLTEHLHRPRPASVELAAASEVVCYNPATTSTVGGIKVQCSSLSSSQAPLHGSCFWLQYCVARCDPKTTMHLGRPLSYRYYLFIISFR